MAAVQSGALVGEQHSYMASSCFCYHSVVNRVVNFITCHYHTSVNMYMYGRHSVRELKYVQGQREREREECERVEVCTGAEREECERVEVRTGAERERSN